MTGMLEGMDVSEHLGIWKVPFCDPLIATFGFSKWDHMHADPQANP